MTTPFAVEALSLRLRSRLGFFTWAATCLPFFLKFPFLPFVPLLETSGFVYHQQLMLFFWFLPSSISASRRAWESFPLSLICYSSSRSSSSLVTVTLENHHYLIWKINSHSIQVIVALRQSEHMLNDWAFLPLVCRLKKLVRGLIPLDVGTILKSQFQSLEHLICSAMFQKRLWCLNSKPFSITHWTIM